MSCDSNTSDCFRKVFIGEFVIPEWYHDFNMRTAMGDPNESPIKKVSIHDQKRELIGGAYFQSTLDLIKPLTKIRVFGFRLKAGRSCGNARIMIFIEKNGCRYFGANGLILACEMLNEELAWNTFIWTVSFCDTELIPRNMCNIPRTPIAFRSSESDKFEIHNGSMSGRWNDKFMFLGFQVV
jgi:hypothetical protein